MSDGLRERLEQIHRRIAEAAQRVARSPSSVRLVAVSKRQPAALVREAYALGVRDFGENLVQELVAKKRELADLAQIRFHLIGHLQRNKAKQAAWAASWVHSVDRAELVLELDRRRGALASPELTVSERSFGKLPVLVQVNVGDEPQKSGCSQAELPALLDLVESSENLSLRGLMCIPPQTDELAATRAYFTELAALREAQGGARRLPELSMGMSGDFEVAVECGATMVRVGTLLFGERPSKADTHGG